MEKYVKLVRKYLLQNIIASRNEGRIIIIIKSDSEAPDNRAQSLKLIEA